MDLLRMMTCGNFRKFRGNDPVVMRSQVSQCEFAVTSDIHAGKAWDP